jgi:hypothetical protein
LRYFQLEAENSIAFGDGEVSGGLGFKAEMT